MGSPVAPDLRQYRRMQEASELGALADAPEAVSVENGNANLEFSLPRQGVSLVMLEW